MSLCVNKSFTINNYNMVKDKIHTIYTKEFDNFCDPAIGRIVGRNNVNDILERLTRLAEIISNPMTAENLQDVTIDLIIDKTTQCDDLLQISSEIENMQQQARSYIDDSRYDSDNDEDLQGNKKMLETNCNVLKNISQDMRNKAQIIQKQIVKEVNKFASDLTNNLEVLPKDLFRVVAYYTVI